MTDFKKWAEGIAGGDRTKIAVTTAHILALRKCACFDSIRKLGGVLIELGAKAPPEAKAGAVGALALLRLSAFLFPLPFARLTFEGLLKGLDSCLHRCTRDHILLSNTPRGLRLDGSS